MLFEQTEKKITLPTFTITMYASRYCKDRFKKANYCTHALCKIALLNFL